MNFSIFKTKVFQGLSLATIFFSFIFLSLACATNSKLSGAVPDNYSEIVELEGTKNSIYTKANLALIDLFYDADSVIEYSDKEEGILKGKYVSKGIMIGINSYKVYSSIEVAVKDGRYRIIMKIADVLTQSWGSRVYDLSVPVSDELLTKMEVEWKAISESFKAKMHKESSW